MRPKAVTQNEVSVDGAIHGFKVHMRTYYRLAGRLGAKVDVLGSETMVASDFREREEGPRDLRKPARAPGKDDWRHV